MTLKDTLDTIAERRSDDADFEWDVYLDHAR